MTAAWLTGVTAAALGSAALALLWRARASPWSRATWATRLMLVTALAMSLASPRAERAGSTRARVVVVDRSRSVSPGGRSLERQARACLSDLTQSDRVALVLAAATPLRASPWQSPDAARQGLTTTLAKPVEAWGSDLGAALRLAGRLAAQEAGAGEVVLISDGRDTGGDAEAAAAALAAAGVRVFTLVPDLPPAAGARLVRVDAPTQSPAGAPLAVTVEAQALTPGSLTLSLELDRGGEVSTLGEATQAAGPGEAVTWTWTTPPLEEGDAVLRARVMTSGRDDAPEDDALEVWIHVGAGPRILSVGGSLVIPGALRVAPEDLAHALAQAPPDLVVLSDVPAQELTSAAAALAAAVDGGAGLAVVGARRAFGPGGYADSRLEALLPVTSGPGRERQRRLLLVVAIDASGSMNAPEGGGSRYVRALESALPLEMLREGDRLAVVLFSDEARLAQPLARPPADLLARLSNHPPHGGTDIGAGLSRALAQLRAGADAEDLLVVLATDSIDSDPTRHEAALREEATSLAGRDAEVLLIQIGEGAGETLEALANTLRPHVKATVCRSSDAGVELQELVEGQLLARRAEVRAGSFAASATAEGRALGLLPPSPISLFTPVRARSEPAYGAQILGTIEDVETSRPPLAVLGRRGLGHTLAVPMEPAQAAPILAALQQRLLPPRRRGVRLRAERRSSRLLFEALGDDLPLGLHVRLKGVDGSSASLELTPRTPDRHTGSARAPTGRAIHATLTDASGARVAALFIPDASHGELARAQADVALMAAVAEVTGGLLLPAPPSPDRPLPQSVEGRTTVALAPWLALLALLLLLLDAAAATLWARRSAVTTGERARR